MTPICHICKNSYSRFSPLHKHSFRAHIRETQDSLSLSVSLSPTHRDAAKNGIVTDYWKQRERFTKPKKKKRNISFLGVKDKHAITYRYKKEIEPFFVEIC